jgi:hypothetical protein
MPASQLADEPFLSAAEVRYRSGAGRTCQVKLVNITLHV